MKSGVLWLRRGWRVNVGGGWFRKDVLLVRASAAVVAWPSHFGALWQGGARTHMAKPCWGTLAGRRAHTHTCLHRPSAAAQWWGLCHPVASWQGGRHTTYTHSHVQAFSSCGDVAYATLRRSGEELSSLLHPRRARQPLHCAFRVFDPSAAWGEVATVDVERWVVPFCR